MTIRHFACLLATCGLLACQSIKGYHEYDVDAPFRDYSTFAWITEEPLIQVVSGVDPSGVHFSPIHEKFIRAAVGRGLEAKGYEEVASAEAADLALSFTLGAREKVRVDSYPVYAGYRYGPYYGGYSSGSVQSYTEGTLAIDVFDNASKQVVWHGWASKRIAKPSKSDETEKSEKRIHRVVDAILRGFPARGAGVGKAGGK